MRKKWMLAVLAVSLFAPTARLRADYDKKESAQDEKAESPAKRQREEQEALGRYQKASAKHGRNSVQAKKAWRHVVAEYKEHGDTPPAQPAAEAPGAGK